MEFIKANLAPILVILILAILFIAFLVILWRRGRKDLVKKIILGLVCRAEKTYGSKTGLIKLADAWAGIYERLPWYIRLVFTKQEIDDFIEAAVEWLKKHLEENPDTNLLSYDAEKTPIAG